MASEYFWGSKPSDHAPVIGGKQFVYDGAFFLKQKAEKQADYIRENGYLARVQKRSITDRFGNKRKVTGHVYVVFRSRERNKK